ncbi:MAG: TlpA family protein disulfide reductase [Bacteroidales bacterium]|nr:TlpA family protein disulfide reductase [Bacteroidales bacterium]
MKIKPAIIIIVLIISALSFYSCKDNNEISINGKIADCKGSKIQLERLSPIKVDTLATISTGMDGSFKFSHNDSLRRLYRLKLENRPPIHLCLVNGESIEITINANNYEISGSNDCKELKRLNDRMTESTQKVEELRSKVSQQFNIDKASLEESNRIADSLYQSDKEFIWDFIKQNHTSPIIYLALHQYVSTTQIMQLPNDYDIYKYVLDEMKTHNPDLEETRHLESMVRKFELQQEQRNRDYVTLSEGSTAPEFSIPDQNGDTIRLSDFKGKEITLCFWASWDKKSVKTVQEYLTENTDRQIILISLDSNREQWLQAIKFHRLDNTINICDFKSWESITAKLYGVKGVPTFIEISDEQKIEKIL